VTAHGGGGGGDGARRRRRRWRLGQRRWDGGGAEQHLEGEEEANRGGGGRDCTSVGTKREVSDRDGSGARKASASAGRPDAQRLGAASSSRRGELEQAREGLCVAGRFEPRAPCSAARSACRSTSNEHHRAPVEHLDELSPLVDL
jgi:hypothetical protein